MANKYLNLAGLERLWSAVKTKISTAVNTAKNEAISTASIDATIKTNDALANAKADTEAKLKLYSTTEEVNSAIEQKANSIMSSVASTYTNKEEFNALEVGGRNYALNSNVETQITHFYVLYQLTDSKNALKDKPIVVSFDAMRPEDAKSVNMYAYFRGSAAIQPNSNTIGDVTTEYKRYYATIAPGADIDNATHIAINTGTTDTSVFIKNVKVEIGTLPTDWTPAPEDIKNALATHVGNTSNPHNVTKSQIGLGNVENKSSATIRGELTKDNVTSALGYTPPTTNTTYSAGTGISLSETTFSNSGVRSISSGSANGTISVNTNGTSANVAVKGLGSAAYTDSSAYVGVDAGVISGGLTADGDFEVAGTLTASSISSSSINGSEYITGTKSVTLNSASSTYAITSLSSTDLGFTPTVNTRIIASIKMSNKSPSPYRYCLVSLVFFDELYFVMSPATGSIQAGTYYIDYLIAKKN